MAKTVEAPVQEVLMEEVSQGRAASRERRRVTLKRWGWRLAGYAFFLTLWDVASGTVMSDRLLVPPIAIAQLKLLIAASNGAPDAQRGSATASSQIAL